MCYNQPTYDNQSWIMDDWAAGNSLYILHVCLKSIKYFSAKVSNIRPSLPFSHHSCSWTMNSALCQSALWAIKWKHNLYSLKRDSYFGINSVGLTVYVTSLHNITVRTICFLQNMGLRWEVANHHSVQKVSKTFWMCPARMQWGNKCKLVLTFGCLLIMTIWDILIWTITTVIHSITYPLNTNTPSILTFKFIILTNITVLLIISQWAFNWNIASETSMIIHINIICIQQKLRIYSNTKNPLL
jgi:hypothetical protein